MTLLSTEDFFKPSAPPPTPTANLVGQIRSTLEYYNTSAADLIQHYGRDYTSGQFIEALFELMLEQIGKVNDLEEQIGHFGSVLSAWAEAWDLDDAAIDDLNALFAASAED